LCSLDDAALILKQIPDEWIGEAGLPIENPLVFGVLREMTDHGLLGNDEFVPSALPPHVSMQVVDLLLDRLDSRHIFEITAAPDAITRQSKRIDPVACLSQNRGQTKG